LGQISQSETKTFGRLRRVDVMHNTPRRQNTLESCVQDHGSGEGREWKCQAEEVKKTEAAKDDLEDVEDQLSPRGGIGVFAPKLVNDEPEVVRWKVYSLCSPANAPNPL
jgi:hypothetical protein